MEIEKVEKLLANLEDEKEYVLHIKSLKQALNRRLLQKKVHRIIKLNQEASLKPLIDMHTNLRKQAKHEFEIFFKLINNTFFGKAMKHMRYQACNN